MSSWLSWPPSWPVWESSESYSTGWLQWFIWRPAVVAFVVGVTVAAPLLLAVANMTAFGEDRFGGPAPKAFDDSKYRRRWARQAEAEKKKALLKKVTEASAGKKPKASLEVKVVKPEDEDVEVKVLIPEETVSPGSSTMLDKKQDGKSPKAMPKKEKNDKKKGGGKN